MTDKAILEASVANEPTGALDVGATPTADVRLAEEEQALCEKVVAHLRKLRPSRPPMQFADDEVLITLRDQIAESRLEDIPALMAQMEQVAAIASNRSKPQVEPINPANPYFGHLRLKEKERGVRDVLIGRTTYIEPREGIRVVDWRHAPVSQLYYRYDEGDSYEETFGDREIEGEVLMRRTVTIDQGELRRITAPQGVYVRRAEGWKHLAASAVQLAGGEGSAVRAEHMRGVMGASTEIDQQEDRHLPEIAALLDQTQFELISRPDAGLVVVQGGAGSGKTTIGVHRMAYLNFQSKRRFAPDRMMVVVATPALRDYIGQLLTALDMGGVRVVTFGGWARRARMRAFETHAQIPIEENTPVEVSRLKTDPVVVDLLHAGASALRRKGRTGIRDAMGLWADVLTNLPRLEAAFEARPASRARLNSEQLRRAVKYCSDRCPSAADWRLDHDAEYEAHEASIAGADGVLEDEDDRATLDPEDDSLLLRAHQLVRGPLRNKKNVLRLEHLFVDEAQDLAAVDLCVLSDTVSKDKSITLAGDTSQRLHLDTGFAKWSEVLDALALQHIEVEPLKIAYRSTKEVLRFARHVLGPLADPEEPIAPRSGAPVEHHHFPTQGAAAAFLGDCLRPLFQREPRATVAILARFAEQADAYHQALSMAEIPNLRRVKDYDFAFKPGVDITEIRQVKGLEYDYIVLLDVNASSYPETDESRYQLHIGATRAAHQLWVLSTNDISPLIPEWLRERDEI